MQKPPIKTREGSKLYQIKNKEQVRASLASAKATLSTKRRSILRGQKKKTGNRY